MRPISDLVAALYAEEALTVEETRYVAEPLAREQRLVAAAHRCCGIASAELDGVPIDARAITLKDDGGAHEVTIVPGADPGLGMQSGATRRAEPAPTEKSV